MRQGGQADTADLSPDQQNRPQNTRFLGYPCVRHESEHQRCEAHGARRPNSRGPTVRNSCSPYTSHAALYNCNEPLGYQMSHRKRCGPKRRSATSSTVGQQQRRPPHRDPRGRWAEEVVAEADRSEELHRHQLEQGRQHHYCRSGVPAKMYDKLSRKLNPIFLAKPWLIVRPSEKGFRRGSMTPPSHILTSLLLI